MPPTTTKSTLTTAATAVVPHDTARTNRDPIELLPRKSFIVPISKYSPTACSTDCSCKPSVSSWPLNCVPKSARITITKVTIASPAMARAHASFAPVYFDKRAATDRSTTANSTDAKTKRMISDKTHTSPAHAAIASTMSTRRTKTLSGFACPSCSPGALKSSFGLLMSHRRLLERGIEAADAEPCQGRLDAVDDRGVLANEGLALAVGTLGIFLREGRDRGHLAVVPLAAQPAEEGALELLGVEPVGLGAPVLARYRHARGMNDVGLDAPCSQPAG